MFYFKDIYFKSFFSKFSSSILKSSELMIFEGRSNIISTAFLLQAVLKICHSSFCAFVSCIWSNSPLRIILNWLICKYPSRTGFYGASPSNFSILLNEGLAEFLVFYYNYRFPLLDSIFLNGISDIFTCWKLSYYWTIYSLVSILKFENCSLGQLDFIPKG